MGGRGGGGKGGAGGGGGGGEIPDTAAKARAAEPGARRGFDKSQAAYNKAVGKQRAYARKHGPAGRNSPQYKSLQRRTMQQQAIRNAARKKWLKVYRKGRSGV